VSGGITFRSDANSSALGLLCEHGQWELSGGITFRFDADESRLDKVGATAFLH
jgi:hypothetical protein